MRNNIELWFPSERLILLWTLALHFKTCDRVNQTRELVLLQGLNHYFLQLMYTHTYIRTHTRTYVHTHTHTHIQIYKCVYMCNVHTPTYLCTYTQSYQFISIDHNIKHINKHTIIYKYTSLLIYKRIRNTRKKIKIQLSRVNVKIRIYQHRRWKAWFMSSEALVYKIYKNFKLINFFQFSY